MDNLHEFNQTLIHEIPADFDDKMARAVVARWLNFWMSEFELNQSQLARHLGSYRVRIHRLANARERLDPEFINRIARVLRVPPPRFHSDLPSSHGSRDRDAQSVA